MLLLNRDEHNINLDTNEGFEVVCVTEPPYFESLDTVRASEPCEACESYKRAMRGMRAMAASHASHVKKNRKNRKLSTRKAFLRRLDSTAYGKQP